jgi:hypothetical protein
MASYMVAFCHCLTISVVTIPADAMALLIQQCVLCGSFGISPYLSQLSADDHFGRCHGFSYSAARPLWKHWHFALPFPIFCR